MMSGKTKNISFPPPGCNWPTAPVHGVGSNPGKKDLDVNTTSVWT